MKLLCLFFAITLLSACGNRKAAIVEEIKKVKNEWAEAEMNRGAYSSAAKRLLGYEMATNSIKRLGSSKQMEQDKLAYKEAYEKAIKELKNVPSEIVGNQKKLDSVAYKYETEARDLKYRIDSLEMELKKY